MTQEGRLSMTKVLVLGKFFLLGIGLVIAFQYGKSEGFKTGSEWALVQADILAREAGVHMPVYLDGENNFRIIMKQPRGVYKRAWELADKYEEKRMLKTAKLKETEQKSGSDGNRDL